jgi:predicted DNA-binding transcriptional regulator AlpA
VESRTAAFYDWELAGRGWREYEHAVALEPPFRPFLGHQAPPPSIDDGRKPTRISRFISWLTSAGAQKQLPAPIEEPVVEPLPFVWSDSLRELDLLAPPALRFDVLGGNHWLGNVATSWLPIAFELVAFNGRVTPRIVAAERDWERIREQTLAFFPGVLLRPSRRSLESIWDEAPGEMVGAMEFALAREFMLPLPEPSARTDLFVPLVSALGGLGNETVAVVQVLFESIRAPWGDHAVRAVTTAEGDPFFMDAPEITILGKKKCSEPLFAASMRLAICASDSATVKEGLFRISTAITSCGSKDLNLVTVLPAPFIDTLVDSIVSRTSRRTGMILSLSDLANFVHVPSDAVQSDRLVRLSARTKAAPSTSVNAPLVLGTNEHNGDEQQVGLTLQDRLRHSYLIGASGTGKSTLLLSMIAQDIASGAGFAVLDPHGDLIDEVLSRIPQHRANDVIVFDPADEEYPVGFNILQAHSELERSLLASDLVAVFRRLSTSFGDQMVTVLGNAIAAILESSEGGTLVDLRRFLVDQTFRNRYLTTVRDREIVSYWQREFTLLKGVPQAPLLTRLNTFLRPKLLRYMVAQKDDRINMRRLMDGRGILLAKLAQGAIGEENSHLLGSLLVAKMAQSAMSRQNEPAESRVPFFLYIDEFHHFVTPSMAAILSGARKYGLGLTLAHQDMRQLKRQSEDVASGVLANASTRVVFRVGDQDARVLADGFSFFKAADLQNLGVGEAIARIERPEFDFNLRTSRVAAIDPSIAAVQRDTVISASRARYASRRSDVEAALSSDFQDEPPERIAPPREKTKRTERSPEASLPVAGSMPGRGGPEHKYLQSLIKRFAEDRGFTVTVEKRVLDGHGHVDVALERDDVSIACEISVSTRLDHEINNLTKCLAAGFDHAVLVCLDSGAVAAARDAIGGLADHNVRCFTPTDLPLFLESLEQKQPQMSSRLTSRLKVKEESPRGRQVQARPNADEQEVEDTRHVLIARDAAEYLGIATQTLAKLRWAGTSPPYFKIGRQVVYKRVELDGWLATRRRRSTTDTGTSD